MIWSEEHELMLCREIVLHEMCQHKDGSRERGQSLDSIVVSLNSVTTIWFKIDQRAFSDKIKKLLQLYSTKRNKKECSFGVGPEDTELDYLLQEIYERKKGESGINYNY